MPWLACSGLPDMSLLTRFLNLFRKEALERELDEELRFHLEKRIERNAQRGLTREEAEAEAHRQFGSITAAKDGMKEVRIMRRYFGGALVGGLAVVAAAITILWLRPAPPSQPASSSQRPVYYRIGEEGTVAPSLVHEQKPHYTPEAMDAKIQGSVVLGCVVQTNGVCSDVRVTRSLDPNGLDLQAINAVQEWRFKPGTRMGEPVPVQVDIAINFTLR